MRRCSRGEGELTVALAQTAPRSLPPHPNRPILHLTPSNPTMPTYTLNSIEVAGTPASMGRQYGEALRDEIRRFVAHRLEVASQYVAERGVRAGNPYRMQGDRCLAVLEVWDPAGYAEHVGVAEGAGVHAADLYAACNYSDIRDLVVLSHPEAARTVPWDVEGCTAFALPPAMTRNGEILCGQTWDLHPRDMEYVVAIHRKPDDAPQTWSITCAGSPTLIGINDCGVYVGTTNIKIHGVRPGAAYLSVLHRAIRERTCEAGAESVRTAPRVAAHTFWIVDEHSAVEIEAAAHHYTQRSLPADAPLLQTNHCLDDLHRSAEAEPPSESSLCRLQRAQELLADGPHDTDSIRRLFSDRADGVNSINRYPEDRGYAATNACVIGLPARRTLWACRGPADQGLWRELTFA